VLLARAGNGSFFVIHDTCDLTHSIPWPMAIILCYACN